MQSCGRYVCELGAGGVSPRPVQGALRHPGKPAVLGRLPPATAGALAARALRRGRASPRSPARRRGKIPRPSPLPAAAHHLGRRGDVLLFQGEVADGAEGLVRAQPVPVTAGEEGTGRGDRPHDHAGVQLVQEQASERPRRRVQRPVSFGFVFSLTSGYIRYDGSRPGVQSASSYDNFCKIGNDVIDDVIIWVQDGNCKKNGSREF